MATPYGLSPRMRGSRCHRDLLPSRRGSIPAYAGKPGSGPRSRLRPRVYPRVCGEALPVQRTHRCRQGLSPRMRGSLANAVNAIPGHRSIPAYAGKPGMVCSSARAFRVYPRVCGEARLRVIVRGLLVGLSPRMRGSRTLTRDGQGYRGSIPAYAGKPTIPGAVHGSAVVYPRVCGEAVTSPSKSVSSSGLSPRMRGSLVLAGAADVGVGSIPAYAGKPRTTTAALRFPRVYPRVCGEAWHSPKYQP